MMPDESSKSMREKQLELNQSAIRKNKHTHFSPPLPLPLRQFTPIQRNTHKNQPLPLSPKQNAPATLLPEPFAASRTEEQPPLSKSRKFEPDNANPPHQRYQFGFDGVRVCQGVIEKYKASNYAIQKNVLERFEREAELFRRNRNQRQQRPTSPLTLPPPISLPPQQNNGFFWQQEEERRRAEEERLRLMEQERERRLQEQEQRRRAQRRMRRQQRDQYFMQREKENLVRVGNMLREIDCKLKENSSKLTADLHNLREQLKPTPKFHNVNEEHLFRIASRVNQNSRSCSKIPVVMYNSQLCNPRLHYQESVAPSLDRKGMGKDSEHMNEVLRLLRKNQERLKMLTECSEGGGQ